MRTEKILKEIEKITNEERFISKEQLEQIEMIPYVYVENCGASGSGKGTLYTVYFMGPETNIELIELILRY